jgi:hypothetical protein
VPADSDPDAALGPEAAWAASGAAALTGRADGPALRAPAGLVPRLQAIAAVVDPHLDPLPLLAKRAAIQELTRNGTTSCGGATRLLRTADGWIALSLARPDDLELVPAWLGIEPRLEPGDDPWVAIAGAVHERPATEVVAAAEGLGLPLSRLGERPAPDLPDRALPVGWCEVGEGPTPRGALGELVVLDLTSLWAGPLCGALLAELGATVRKVESVARPDGARVGAPQFWEHLNGKKELVELDLSTDTGRRQLATLAADADVVLEASRPRALRQLGVVAEALLADARPRAWVSITAHGRTGSSADRVGFGDDAAVAGGLVAWEGGEPVFCADAIGDPVSGLAAAAAVCEALERRGRWLIDVPMAAVSAHLAAP